MSMLVYLAFEKKVSIYFKAFNIFSKDVFFVRDYNFPYVSGNISIFLIIIISNQAIFFHENLRIKYYCNEFGFNDTSYQLHWTFKKQLDLLNFP